MSSPPSRMAKSANRAGIFPPGMSHGPLVTRRERSAAPQGLRRAARPGRQRDVGWLSKGQPERRIVSARDAPFQPGRPQLRSLQSRDEVHPRHKLRQEGVHPPPRALIRGQVCPIPANLLETRRKDSGKLVRYRSITHSLRHQPRRPRGGQVFHDGLTGEGR